MERRISFKNLYLVGVISLGLIGLGVGSTFAMFTASAEISDPISLTSGLNYQDDIVDLVDMTISSNKVETATLNITNNTDKTLNYTSWYKTNDSNLQIGTVVSNGYSVTGTIEPNASAQIIVSIRNRGTGVAKVTVGISASDGDIVVSDKATTLPTDPLPPYLNDYITSLYTSNTKSDVTNNSITYHYATDVNLMNDRLGDSTIDIDKGNIRYYGSTPSNYIDIGDKYETDYTYIVANKMQEKVGDVHMFDTLQECYDYTAIDNEYCKYETIPAGTPILWRVIGVFDGKVRIVRDESIGYYSWDSSSYTEGKKVNYGYGINEWSQADIMKLLNPGYDNNSDEICTYDYHNPYSCLQSNALINNSLWWNSESGTCYTDYKNISRSCDFTSTGLSDDAKKYIFNQIIYLGSLEYEAVFPDQAYISERGTTTYNQQMTCSYNPEKCTDNIIRTTSWIGKSGLIYPSDYGYASDLSNCNATLDDYSSENGTCHLTNWLFNGRYHHNYTSTPYRTNAFGIYMVHDETIDPEEESINLYFHDEYNAGTIRPTLVLNPKVVLESGTGTSADPFVID